MARESLVIEMDEKAVNHLYDLMAHFGERRPDDMISTALGVLGTLKDYTHDGVLTVVDPRVTSHDAEEREVDIVFEKAKANRPTERAA
jgi:hypothetical protein